MTTPLQHLDVQRHGAVATVRLHDREAVFVGGVVAREHGPSARERRLPHETLDGRTLAGVRGLHLHHGLATKQLQAGVVPHGIDHGVHACGFQFGCEAEMQRHGGVFVFDQQTRVFRRQCIGRCQCRTEVGHLFRRQ